MTKKEKKEELERLRAEFLRVVTILRKDYLDKEIAQKARINPTNFSHYVSGTKKPGFTTLKRFFMAFENESTQPDGNTKPNGKKPADYKDDDAANQVNEALVREIYETKAADQIKELKQEKERFWKNLEDALQSNKDTSRGLKEAGIGFRIWAETYQAQVLGTAPKGGGPANPSTPA